jgi:hypothetical protein
MKEEEKRFFGFFLLLTEVLRFGVLKLFLPYEAHKSL